MELIKEKSQSVEKLTGIKNEKSIKFDWIKFHRIAGLIMLIPVFLWSFSGLMHPIMSRWVKVDVPKRNVERPILTTGDFQFSLQDVLNLNSIDDIRSFNMVTLNQQLVYQIESSNGLPRYFSSVDGIEIEKGDVLYAKSLARYFMQEFDDEITSVRVVEKFTDQYRFINRLLPVYQISFEDKSGLDVYIHTSSSRLGTANDDSRKLFQWIFNTFHNWGLFSPFGILKPVIMSFFLGLIVFSAISGLYIYIISWKRLRKSAKKGSYRLWHRRVGIAVSLVTLTFSLSGGFHLLHKTDPYRLDQLVDNEIINKKDLQKSLSEILGNLDMRVNQISLVNFKDEPFYRLAAMSQERKEVRYLSALNGRELTNGDEKYADYLAKKFSGESEIGGRAFVTRFSGEYGFVNKRLPVRKVSFKSDGDLTYYIETSTRRAAAVVENLDRWEGFSFAFLHKYHTLDFAGKNFRDIVMSLAAIGIMVVSVFGFMLYLKPRN